MPHSNVLCFSLSKLSKYSWRTLNIIVGERLTIHILFHHNYSLITVASVKIPENAVVNFENHTILERIPCLSDVTIEANEQTPMKFCLKGTFGVERLPMLKKIFSEDCPAVRFNPGACKNQSMS